ncbi:DUF6356 family protein [Sphingomonas hylomeconis]|uniref:DUF6356 family protein n=1 Tax=Sphingomonas hylomeconis TaxID=1395958 RepID=A0ABV7SZA8_9SPHN|nr:DUF6356 family protein [Sphingomonas hylomeconis]
MLRKIFSDHPRSVGETYGQHLTHALSFAGAMIGGGILCAIHAFIPVFFKKSGSTVVRDLYERMVRNR